MLTAHLAPASGRSHDAAMPDPLLSVAPWPDDHGTLKLTGLLTVEICALYRTDTSWPGNLTATEIGDLAREQCGGPWPGYPPCDSESPTVLVYPDGMPGIWGRGATLQEASEALCARMLVLLRDLPSLFGALREGASFFGAVAKDRTTADFIAKAKPLAYLFSDRGYEYEQAAVLARASAKLAAAEKLSLPWYVRDAERAASRLPPDGLWNGPTACGSTICGIEADERAAAERLHFETCVHGCKKASAC